jgi:hypothetical protein
VTLKIQTFQARHAVDLKLAKFQLATLGKLDESYGRMLEAHCRIAQSLVDNQRVLACWGLLPLWRGLSEAWLLVSDDIGKSSLILTRALNDVLDVATENRIQTSVLENFDKGHKFAQLLGFEPEGLMRAYDVLGRNHVRYARINHG